MINNTNNGAFAPYTSPDGSKTLQVFINNETAWLTQQKIADLFDVTKSTISEHLKNIFEQGELEREATVRNFRTVQIEGEREVTRELEFYNFDAIISVGYRVNSAAATKFRQWATRTLREFIVKGFVIDDERLKNPDGTNKDHYEELLERVHAIRTSERRIYQQITDIFRDCCIDYTPNAQITQTFFATIQNKFHYAITGSTAAEIQYDRADATKENMGLTTWGNAPNRKIMKSDVTTAKNYLAHTEIKKLEKTISNFFDYIERQLECRKDFTMALFADNVNKFLNFYEFKILDNPGSISKLTADKKALNEYASYNKLITAKAKPLTI